MIWHSVTVPDESPDRQRVLGRCTGLIRVVTEPGQSAAGTGFPSAVTIPWRR